MNLEEVISFLYEHPTEWVTFEVTKQEKSLTVSLQKKDSGGHIIYLKDANGKEEGLTEELMSTLFQNTSWTLIARS